MIQRGVAKCEGQGSFRFRPPTICATFAASVAGDSLIGECRCQPDGCRRWKPNRPKFIPNETPSGWIVRTRMGIFTPILSPRKACMYVFSLFLACFSVWFRRGFLRVVVMWQLWLVVLLGVGDGCKKMDQRAAPISGWTASTLPQIRSPSGCLRYCTVHL